MFIMCVTVIVNKIWIDFFSPLASAERYLFWSLFCRPSVLVFMKVTFWIMKTKTKKNKLDCSLYIYNVYVFFFPPELVSLCTVS